MLATSMESLRATPDPPDTPPSGKRLATVVENVERVILGKREAVVQCVVALLSNGHVLLEDAPGTGKTSLARALAKSLALDFRRIQCTSDLLPSDVLGVAVYSARRESFEFQPGPIFANVVLADELNRASPRTQSALLECMDERCVTIDGETRELPRPFLMIATQNPIDFEGTHPLPESQLDRFAMRIELGYPGRDDERTLLTGRLESEPLDGLEPVITELELRTAQRAVSQVRVEPALVEYALEIVRATRRAPDIAFGASPRAGLAWLRAARALALVEGRDFCLPDDLKRLAQCVLAHRIFADGTRSAAEALAEILNSTPAPE